MIPYGRQDIGQSDIDAVVEVLQSDFLTQGPTVPRFEELVARRMRSQHALAMNSATSALHAACLALELGPGDVLWTVPNTFVASANCARFCGAAVDFVDIDPQTWNISVEHLEQKLTIARQKGRAPKVVVPVHFGGQATNQQRIWDLAQEFGFRVLEDASHAIGATRDAEPVGSCRWSDITVFSFHPVKVITTGEGGMALTNNTQLAERMALFRSHGITRDASMFKGAPPGEWYYEQQVLGFNYRMTDIAAALGIAQFDRLDKFVARRNELAQRYTRLLQGLPITLPTVQPENRSAFHLYVVRLDVQAIGKSHSELFHELRQSGVSVNVHYFPVHLQPYYRELGFTDGYCPEAEAHGRQAITLPLYPLLTESQQDAVIAALKSALRHGG